ncbi:MAG: Cobalamin biosynthesis protein CbiM [Acidimicrobiales bacterium]|nr:Cobalamin biosynthesis protein CbiM [Acidimicrobiales bacterium]
MHIPDGYLSPATCAGLGAGMVPAWWAAGRRVRRVVTSRSVPLLALGSAFCFVVMMFNVPVPNGTTAHAAGGVLVAILLGPWAAVIAVSTALLIQALFFGDGGVLAYGANCFNLALVMPMVGYGTYRLAAGRSALTSRRRAVAAGVGGYVGINAGALCVAIELGLQPTLFHDAQGAPLYAPFHLSQTIPAVLGAHLLVAGVVELALTVGVLGYLQRANQPVLRLNPAHARLRHRPAAVDAEPEPASGQGARGGAAGPVRPGRGGGTGWRWALIGLAVMVLLTPLGLLAPGTAFGESSPRQLDLAAYHLDAVPHGLQRYAGFWHGALFDGYGFAGARHPTVAYLVSALVGTLVIGGVVLGLSALVGPRQRRRHGDAAGHPDDAADVDLRAAAGRVQDSGHPGGAPDVDLRAAADRVENSAHDAPAEAPDRDAAAAVPA